MNEKYYCVIDAEGWYKTFVLVLLEPAQSGETLERVQYYTLFDSEALIDAPPPSKKLHAGAQGHIQPRWNGTEWTEGATPAEISAWQIANPAPINLQYPSIEDRIAAIEAVQLKQTLGGAV